MATLLFEFAVRSALVALGTGLVLWALRIKSAAVRHAAWTAVVIATLLLPIWSITGPRVPLRLLQPAPGSLVPDRARVGASPDAGHSAQATSAVAPTAGELMRPLNWENILISAYALGVVVLLARLVIGTVQANRLRRSALIEPVGTTSAQCVTPITVGWFKPVLILPSGWRRWPAAKLEAVLTHEAEHARRRDPLVQWLALFNRAVYWFHPLSWWLERRLSTLAEEACDTAVLAAGHSPHDYSEYLLDMARALSDDGRRLRVAGMAMPGSGLPQRMRHILEGLPMAPTSRARVACTIVFCAMSSVMFAVGTLAPRSPAAAMQSAAAPAGKPRFETASIKPCPPEAQMPGGARGAAGGTNASVSPGRFTVPCVTLEQLIYLAYASYGAGESDRLANDYMGTASDDQKIRGGPAWVHSYRDKYAIEATAPGVSDRLILMGTMLRTLLEERFHLKTHRASEEMPMFAMRVAKSGLKVKPMKDSDCDPPTPADRSPCGFMTNSGARSLRRLHYVGFQLGFLARQLADVVGAHVIDETGITAKFTIDLEFASDQASTPSASGEPAIVGPSVFTALEQQLGLKLEKTKGPRGYIVIDRAERPTPDSPAPARAMGAGKR